MTSPKSPPPDLPGFTFQAGIGGGGFADVFLYTQHSTGRGVAVKVLRAEHLSDASLAQFKTEANVMAGVSTHPYIVTIHDAGVAPDGRPFIVMEHYPNPHFGTRAAGGRLGVAEVLRVAVQVAAAVETAHRARILHRDIKPANILTSAYNDPGLADFGIAGVQLEEGMSSASGISLGYAAPEVILDEYATGTVASDVYSLAATIYALLTGRSPFYVPGGDNSRGSFAARVTSGNPHPLNRPDVPRTFQHLISAGMSVDPRDRPSSAASLARALQDVEQSLHLPPTPLVLVGDPGATATPRPEADENDGDGTRRRPIVVDADGRSPTTSGSRATLAQPPAPADAASASLREVAEVDPTRRRGPHRATEPEPSGEPRVTRDVVSDVVGDDLTGSTVRRAPPVPSTSPGTDGGETGAPPRGRRTVVLAAVAVGLVAAGGLSFVFGSGSGEEPSPTTLRPRIEPQDPGFTSPATALPAPEDLVVTWAADGSVQLAWTMPEVDTDRSSIAYRVVRTDDGAPEGDARTYGSFDDPLDVPEFTIAAQELGASGSDGRVCFTVHAVAGAIVSDWSSEACTP